MTFRGVPAVYDLLLLVLGRRVFQHFVDQRRLVRLLADFVSELRQVLPMGKKQTLRLVLLGCLVVLAWDDWPSYA